jgi:TonB family protein
MRPVQGWVSFAAVAAFLGAAEAAPKRPPAERVGEWRVEAYRLGACAAHRDYPGGSQLSVSSASDGAATLSVFNRSWSMQGVGPYRLRLIRDGAAKGFAAEANPYLHGLGVLTPRGPALLAQLAAGGTVEVARSDGTVLDRLDLRGIGPALARLGPCGRDVATRANFPPVAPPPPPPPPQRGTVRPARAQALLHQLLSNADYPAAAIRAGEQGLVGFRLDVGKDGRVTGCAITASSGSAILDSTTCQLMIRRARFTPALDHEGKPTEDKVAGRILWRLPEPEPPPPPAPE